MEPVWTFHNLGLLSLIIILLSLGLMLKVGGTDVRNSLSGHAAIQRRSYAVFVAALAGGGILFYLFAVRWLEPTLHLALPFNVILVLTVVCELTAAFIPDSGGKKSLVHRTFAWSMAKGAITILLAYMVLDWCLFLFVKSSHRFFLVFQSTYVLSFYLATLATTYIR